MVHTSARLDAGRPVLEMKIDDWRSKEWTPLMPDHGKLMHLFLLREPGLDAFAHVHPLPAGKDAFRAVLPPLPAGSYRVYADVVHESGFPQTLVDTVTVPASPAGAVAPSTADADDSVRSAGMAGHILSQHLVHSCLPTFASRLEELDDFRAVAHRQQLFLARGLRPSA
jgi:hypothetical protein